MDFPRIRSTFGVTPYAPGRKRPLERDEEDTIADIPNPEMMQKEPEIYDRPFPPGVAMQEAFDDMLQRRIVDPLAKAGYEDVGAGFAAIPSAAHSMIVPQTEFDIAGTLIPLPGVAKLMKKGKFRKISKAMHVEDPENAAQIIAKQASKEGGPVNLDPEAQKIAKVKQEKFLRKQTDDPTKKELSYQDGLTFKGGFVNYDNPDEILKQYNEAIKSPPNNTYIGSNISGSFTVDPAKSVGPARQLPIDPSHMAKTNHIGSGVELGNPDPLAWMDTKKGVTRDWLINTKGTPRLIETQSDLIAHDDYMSNLMPGDRVVFHIYTDNNHLNRIINPGGPSTDRVLHAAKKLAKAGIDVKIVKNSPDTLKTLPNHDLNDINAIKLKDSGIKFEERNLALDDAQESRLRKMLGMEAEAPKDPRSDFRKMQDDLSEFAVKPKGEAKTPLKSVEPPKPPKGDPEASLPRQPDKFSRVRSQLDVAPSRMDERGKAFGDVGQSEFTPYDRPSPQFEEIQKRNYVERDMDPVDGIIDQWRNSLDPNELEQLTPEILEKAKKAAKASIDQGKSWSIDDLMHDETGKFQPTKYQSYEKSLIRTMHPSAATPGQFWQELSKSLKPFKDKNNNVAEFNPIVEKLGKSVKDSGAADIQRTPRIRALESQDKKAFFPSPEAKSLQKEMYKGRPSHEAEQAKLFPKVKEAVKGKAQAKSGPGYTQGRYHVKDWAGNDMPQFGTYDDMEEAIDGVYDYFRKQGLDDDALDEVLEDLTVQERKGWKPSKKVTKEESDRLLEEKLKDF